MRNRYLLGAGAALTIAWGGIQAHAQFLGPLSAWGILSGSGGRMDLAVQPKFYDRRPGSGRQHRQPSGHRQLQ